MRPKEVSSAFLVMENSRHSREFSITKKTAADDSAAGFFFGEKRAYMSFREGSSIVAQPDSKVCSSMVSIHQARRT